MKRIRKILYSVLILSILAFTVALFASAGIDTEAEAQTDSPKTPIIVSNNINYSSYIHVMYAIPADTVEEGYTPYLEIYFDGNEERVLEAKEFKIETISAITGEARPYYVFNSPGIAPKNITREVYATPCASDENGNTVKGETVRYSVAEYCYERLCSDGFALVTDEDSDDYIRRKIYESLLAYGDTVYDLLGSDSLSPKEYCYFSAWGTNNDSVSSSAKYGDTITLTYDPSVLENHFVFAGFEIISYTPDGIINREIIDKDTITVTVPYGGLAITVLQEKDSGFTREDEIAEQEIIDEAIRTAQWAALEEAFVEELGYSQDNAADVTEAIKLLYTLYGKELVTWVASLYSKGYMDAENEIWAGGFYASTAGRDTYGYGPDLQCTVQLLRFLESSGVFTNAGDDVPEWMRHQLVYFAKSLQHENGYFYHPQWGKEFTDTKLSRRGRDLSWGITLLEEFGERPQYTTPSGTSGDGQSADEYLESVGITKDAILFSETALTTHLGSSAAEMVSAAVYIAASEADDGTAYLQSHTAFINYLLTDIEPGMKTNQYVTGNTINATDNQINGYSNSLGVYTYKEGDEAATEGAVAEDYKRFDGMTLKEMALEVLLTTVNPKTGLYGGYQEDGSWLGKESLTFSHSNGFFKVISVINGWGGVYPYAALAAESLITNLVNENLPSTGNACDVYNIWNAINSLKNNKASSDIVWAKVTSDNVISCNEGDEGAVSMTVMEFLNKSLEVRGADAVRITYSKYLGYKKSDGAFSHSYLSGVTYHQGCPVSPPDSNVGDVDATTISSTGLVRSMFDAFGLGSYRPDFFGRADYYRFIDYLEAAKPIRKTDDKNLKEDFEDASLKNEFTGDLVISDGALTVNGNASISLSPLSPVGSAISFISDINMSADTVNISILSGESAILNFRITRSGSKIIITNVDTDSYAVLASDSDSFKLTVEITSGNKVSEVKIYEGGALLYQEIFPYELPIKDYTDVNSLLLSTDGAVKLDNTVFAITNSSSSVINDQNRIDFENITEGTLDASELSGSIEFKNPSAGEQNASRALVVVESNNKFLRLEDNYYSGSNSQDYFEFRGESKICETAVFEARMRINTAKSSIIPIAICDKEVVYYGGLKISGGYLYAGVANSKSGLANNMVKTNVRNNEWFTVRIEYTAADVYSADSFFVAIYINDSEEPIDYSNEKCDTSTLNYGSASGVYRYRMAADTAWTGILDYDDIFIGAKQDYKKLENEESTGHTHSLYTEIQSFDDGSYTQITKCASCGETLGECYMKPTPPCVPGNPVMENRIESTCSKAGSYDLVVYCTECGEEISRETVMLPLAEHSEAVREENHTESTCSKAGSYDLVVYCTECGEEISRETVMLPLAEHSEAEKVENRTESTCSKAGSYDLVSYCSECGEEFSRKTVMLPLAEHSEAVREDNRIEPSCTEEGSVDLVTWCTVCEETLSVTNEILPIIPHSIVDGACTVCGLDSKIVYVDTGDLRTNVWIEYWQADEDGSLTIISPGRVSICDMEMVSPGVYKVKIPLLASVFNIISDDFDGIFEFIFSDVAEESTIYIRTKLGDGNDIEDGGWVKEGLIK